MRIRYPRRSDGRREQKSRSRTPTARRLRRAIPEAPRRPAPELATLEGRIADLTDRLLRAHAEMDNLRKRTERDKEDTAKYAISKFAREVLSRRRQPAARHGRRTRRRRRCRPGAEGSVDGVGLTEREFLNVLERNGVKRIDPEGRAVQPASAPGDDRDRAAGRRAGHHRSGLSARLCSRGPRAAPGHGRRGQGRRKARRRGHSAAAQRKAPG